MKRNILVYFRVDGEQQMRSANVRAYDWHDAYSTIIALYCGEVTICE